MESVRETCLRLFQAPDVCRVAVVLSSGLARRSRLASGSEDIGGDNNPQLFDPATNSDDDSAHVTSCGAENRGHLSEIYIVSTPTKGNRRVTDGQISEGDRLIRRRGVAAEELRRHNLSAVLDRLHVIGPTSRSELAQRTGLNRSTIADLIGELVDLGLATEGPGLASSGPGRPSPLASARPDGGVVIAVELAVDSLAVTLVGLGGHVYDKASITRPRGGAQPEETVEDIARLVSPMIGSLPPRHLLAGVGVAVAGLIRRPDGFVYLAPNLGWKGVPLGAMLSQRLGQSHVLLANEADLGALAEYRRGAGTGVGHLIYVASEVGIGAGIIQDGRPMLGSTGYAGETGHTMINPLGRKCRCGAVGCWETEAGEEALARKAGIADSIRGQDLRELILKRVEERDTRTLDALSEVGRWLGLGIGNLINTFNPDLILVGGVYDPLFPTLKATIMAGAAESGLEAPLSMARIERGELGGDAPLVGAAELALSRLIADPARFAGKRALVTP